MVTISALQPEDRAEWEPLWAGYLTYYKTDLAPEISEATHKRLVTEGSGLHGAIARDESGKAVGIVHWLTHLSTWATTDYTYLEDLFVHPDARSGGVGRALIEHVRTWAIEHGSTKVYWLTEYENHTAQALYNQLARTEFIQYEMDL
ncbi:GNAT family N-acetyltransferase [Nocardioides sp. Kera G14]|uniref:GNAT family N-acetyltransferase n=1 Tax=Nocardioides sp. Kera G14 TaxID=2884264 RepID=UPI001D117404|nr:GNAT family N-acetyltransferase [Nocardioides sp. Kera G14]UDY24366.1 GNAT family N-acetyltransferase [Nocardioides sp. Kera G14]